jgi:hypothetical protein
MPDPEALEREKHVLREAIGNYRSLFYQALRAKCESLGITGATFPDCPPVTENSKHPRSVLAAQATWFQAAFGSQDEFAEFLEELSLRDPDAWVDGLVRTNPDAASLQTNVIAPFEEKYSQILAHINGLRADGESEPPRREQEDSPLPEFMSARDLAEYLGLGEQMNAVDIFLRRLREDGADCFIENESRRVGDPLYLYRSAETIDELRRHFRLF